MSKTKDGVWTPEQYLEAWRSTLKAREEEIRTYLQERVAIAFDNPQTYDNKWGSFPEKRILLSWIDKNSGDSSVKGTCGAQSLAKEIAGLMRIANPRLDRIVPRADVQKVLEAVFDTLERVLTSMSGNGELQYHRAEQRVDGVNFPLTEVVKEFVENRSNNRWKSIVYIADSRYTPKTGKGKTRTQEDIDRSILFG